MKPRIGYVATLAVGLAIGITTVGSAIAAPSAPKVVTHHYALAASAFAPDSILATGKDYFNQWDPANLLNSGGGRCFNAGLSLPANAFFKSISFYLVRGDSTMSFELIRQELINQTFVILASGHSNPASAPVYTAISKKVKAGQANVDMSRFAYSVGVCPRGTTTFAGVIVTYTQPAG